MTALYPLWTLDNINYISAPDKDFCDRPITLAEVLESIKYLKVNKSPGIDGLTSEFYQKFAKIWPFLLEVIYESIRVESLPPTLTQSLITLIPKPKKYLLLIDNWRPISLLNCDYKIIATIFAKRLKIILQDIIDETQSGFLKNRHISNNVRLVLDLLDYSELVKDDSYMLFLDFYKAFDSIEHGFIFKTLEKIGFGDLFIKTIKTLYAHGNSSIKLKYGTSPRFDLQRGIRQGCPIPPYLFILTTQLLANHIKNSTLQGVSVMGREIIISQLADDTTLFLKNSDQIPLALNTIKLFSNASGLLLNVHKCELMPVKKLSVSSICDIQVKETITYLGIVISKNPKLRCDLNFLPILEKTKRKLNQWLQRDLSLKGRILLSKAEGISRLTYAAISLEPDKAMCKKIDQQLCNFVWKNKTHYVKKSVLSNSYSNGGLNFVDFATLNNTF